MAFGVKQKNPTDADCECYLGAVTPKQGTLPILGVETEDSAGKEATVAAATPSSKIEDILKGITQKLDKFE